MSEANAQIESFIKKMHSLNDVDYGDFKRKMSLYLNQLQKTFVTPKRPENKVIVERLWLLLVYNNPTNDIEKIKHQAEALASRLQ